MRLRIYDQRRRITFVVMACMAAAYLGLGFDPGIATAGFAALILVIAMLRLLPGSRKMTEAAAVGLLIASSLPLSPLLILVLATGFAGLAYLGFYGTWLDRAGVLLRLTSQRKSWIAQPRTAVWSTLVPGAAHPDDHWSGTLIDYDHDPDDDDTLYLRFRNTEHRMDEVTMTFLDRDPGFSCRYLLERSDPTGAEDMIVSITLTDEENGCLILSEITHDTLSPGVALARWFDDSFGDELRGFAIPLAVRHYWGLATGPRPVPDPAAA